MNDSRSDSDEQGGSFLLRDNLDKTMDIMKDGWVPENSLNAKDLLRSKIIDQAKQLDSNKEIINHLVIQDPQAVKQLFDELQELTNKTGITIDEIKILDLVSESNCSKLYKVLDKSRDKIMFLKIIDVRDEQDNMDAYRELSIYLKILKKNDPLLLQVQAVEIKNENDYTDIKYYILFEGGNGSLKDNAEFRLSKNIEWDIKELWAILDELVIQIQTLSEIGIFNRDIKLDHVILTQNGAKFLDFAQASYKPSQGSKLDIAGSHWYMAPEIAEAHKKLLKRTEYNLVATESFSLGMTMLRILNTSTEDKNKLLWMMERGFKPLFELVREMVVEDENKRKTYQAIYQSRNLSVAVEEMNKKASNKEPVKLSKLETANLEDLMNFVKKNVSKRVRAGDVLSLLSFYYSLGQYYEFTACLDELKPEGSRYEELKPREKYILHEIIAKNAMSIGDEKKALTHYTKVLEYQSQTFGKDSPLLATTYLLIGGIYLKLEDYDKAIENYKASLRIRDLTSNLIDNSKGVLLFDLGIALEKKGDTARASKIYERALETFETLNGKNHASVATAYNYLAGTQETLGKYTDALKNFERALMIRKGLYPEGHPSIGVSYNNLGLVYERLGDFKKAKEFYTKGLEIWQKYYGPENEKIATALNNIGSAYDNLKEFKKAEEFYKKALDIRVRLLGEDHRSVAQSYNNIGTVFYYLQKYDKAIENYNKCLKIWTNNYGDNHPKIATAYNNLASAYRGLGKNDLAKEYFEKCLEIKISTLNKYHPSLATGYVNLGELNFTLGDREKAIEYFELAKQIKEEQLGKDHQATKDLENFIAKLKKKK